LPINPRLLKVSDCKLGIPAQSTLSIGPISPVTSGLLGLRVIEVADCRLFRQGGIVRAYELVEFVKVIERDVSVVNEHISVRLKFHRLFSRVRLVILRRLARG